MSSAIGRPARTGLCLLFLLLPWTIFSEEMTSKQLERLLDSAVHHWRWHLGEISGAERADFDDSKWQPVNPGFKWWPHDSTGWFRTRIIIPEKINGIPINGGTVRMKVGVDNAAKAYVNGEFKQEFEWSRGDFILTQDAHPGEVITVALHVVNRPGSGSLLEASLIYGRAEALVNALRRVARDFNSALEDAPFISQSEAAQNFSRVKNAMQALDLYAYESSDGDAFLTSVKKATDILVSERNTLEGRLQKTAENLQALKEKIRQGLEAGKPMSYAMADARVVESFLKYTREDLSETNIGHNLRGLRGAAYIEKLCADALASDKPEPVVPKYKTAPITIRDGAFWQNERPVYFTGVGHFNQVREDIPILNDYGLNIIQIEMGPQNALPTADNVDLDSIRQNVVQALDKAAVHNVAVNLLISPHYFPRWAFDADPAHAQCGRGFIKFCIEAPNTQIVMGKWLDALMPLIAHHPALHSICLSNEPQYQGRCSYDREKFQQWLKTRWGTIEKVNSAYGTQFRRFEEIDLPRDDSNYGLYFERWRFNQERFEVFHQLLIQRIHRYDPILPVHAKVMSQAFEDPGRFEAGIDYERFTQLGRIAGNDCVMDYSGQRRGEYACDWQTMAMNYTLQRSAALVSPIFNSENHLIPDGDPRYFPENYIRTVFWQQAIHGQGATTTWVWERGQAGDFAENILTRANCVRAFGRVGLDLQRLAPEIHALSQAESKLGILYAYSSLLPSMDYFEEVRAAFEGAYFCSAIPGFVSDSQIESDRLLSHKLIVIPRAFNASDRVVQGFNRFIEKGGMVITVGHCLGRNEYGQSRSQGLVQSGKGRLVAYPDSLSAQAYRDILERLLVQTGANGPIKLEGARGESIWGVNYRAVPYKGKLLLSLLNLSRDSRILRLVAAASIKEATNLLDGKRVEFPMVAQPLEPFLLELKMEAN
jgi:hypothetical protein